MATFSSCEAGWLEPDETPECRECEGTGETGCDCDSGECPDCCGEPVVCHRCKGTGVEPEDDFFDPAEWY
jgi:hypothetical protein